jgi:hypothetical protein
MKGRLLDLRFKDNHVIISLRFRKEIFEVRANRSVAVKMMRNVIEEMADEKVKRSRWYSTWTSACSCGPRSYGNVNLTMFLCPCPLIVEILEYIYRNGKGARKAVQNQLLEHLFKMGYSEKEIKRHLRGLHQRVGAIVPTKKGYAMTEFGVAVWRHWRKKFRLSYRLKQVS